jgi:ArsR family transcriptional regulator, lead/cadmium/zinc/bismuth-responsive transcriptional repressor
LTYEQMFIYQWFMSATLPVIETPSAAECESPHSSDSRVLATVRERLLGTSTVDAIADVFKLLGDPTRVRLVDALTHGERCVCDLAALVGLSESAVSHQLRLLRAAHLVRVRRAGRLAFYSLDDHHVVGLVHDTRKHVEEHA